MFVLTVGQHHMVEPEEWLDMLPDRMLPKVPIASLLVESVFSG
jgi:hypothetical protein